MSASNLLMSQVWHPRAGWPATVAAGTCPTAAGEAKTSPGRAGRAAGVAAQTGDDPDRHRTEHPLHAGPRMVNADRLDPVIPQEPCHPGMMSTFGPLIVKSPPADRELLPAADLAAGHLGDRDAIRPPPARVDLAIRGDRHAHLHLNRPPLRRRPLAGHHVTSGTDQTRCCSMRCASPRP